MSSGQRIPFELAVPIAQTWVNRLGQYCDHIEIAGSIRRRKESVGDIEIVALPRMRDAVHFQPLLGPEFRRFLETEEREKAAKVAKWGMARIKERNEWTRTTALAVAKRTGKAVTFTGGWPGKMTQIALPEGIVLDLFTPTREAFALILLIRTGSAEFSQTMLTLAACSGWISQEGRVYRRERREGKGVPVGDPIELPNEQAIFDLLGVRWVSPPDRLGAESVLLSLSSPPSKQFRDAVDQIRRNRT